MTWVGRGYDGTSATMTRDPQIPNLRSQISDPQSQIPNLRSQISDLKSQIPNIRSQIPY